MLRISHYREVPNLSHCGYSFVGGLGDHKTLATPVPNSKQQPTLPLSGLTQADTAASSGDAPTAPPRQRLLPKERVR